MDDCTYHIIRTLKHLMVGSSETHISNLVSYFPLHNLIFFTRSKQVAPKDRQIQSAQFKNNLTS